MQKEYKSAMYTTPSPVKGKDMMERRRADRKAEYDPVDIVYPRDKYIFTSSFVSKALAFTVKRKIDSLNSAIDSIITSAKDSLEQMSALINLATLVDEDPRLCDHLDSQVFPHLVQFLEQDVEAVYEDDITKEGPEDNKSFKFQYYSAVVLSKIVCSNKGTKYKDEAVVSSNKGIKLKDEAVPLLLNLIPSPDRLVQMQVLETLTKIADAFPDSSDTMIQNGALELLESLLSHKWNHYLVLKGGAQLLTVFCQMKPPLPFDKIEIVVRTISTAIEYEYEPVLIHLCLALSILCDRGLVAVGTESGRLIDLICYQEPEVVIPALRIIGNYVRWGDDELIECMFDQGLLIRLRRLLNHKHTILRKETCWIISNITAAANQSQLQSVIDWSFIGELILLVENDEFEVKEYGACAISNAISGSDREQFEFLEDKCYPRLEIIRVSCQDDRVFTICSEILDKILCFTKNSLFLNIYSEFLKSALVPSTANLASASPVRKKFIKGKKLFASASPPNFEDLDSPSLTGD